MNIFARPWDIVFFAGFVAYLAIRAVYVRRTKTEPKVDRLIDALEKFLMALVMPASVIFPLLYLFTPLLSFADYPLPAFAPWLGTLALLAALWLFWRSHADLGQNWSVTLEIREQHQLVCAGVYTYLRHPMYASIFLWGLAQGLLVPNWLAGWCAFVTFSVMYVMRVPREEQLMCEHFGQQYQQYMAATGRVLPRLKQTRPSAKDASHANTDVPAESPPSKFPT